MTRDTLLPFHTYPVKPADVIHDGQKDNKVIITGNPFHRTCLVRDNQNSSAWVKPADGDGRSGALKKDIYSFEVESLQGMGKGCVSVGELKRTLDQKAKEFVRPNVSDAVNGFLSYEAYLHTLDRQHGLDAKEKKYLVRYGLYIMIKEMEAQTAMVRQACIAGAFINPTFVNAQQFPTNTESPLLQGI